MIEDGRLVAYLYDHLTAEREGTPSTGNGRRGFRHLPIPRMTNTSIAPGANVAPEEMIAEVEKGFYAVSFGGGQVDPATETSSSASPRAT